MLGSGQGQRGVLEMAAEEIFNQISESINREFLIRVSFVEIYNENIRDLLSDAADASVAIREDPRKGVYCEASELGVRDYETILKALKKGNLQIMCFHLTIKLTPTQCSYCYMYYAGNAKRTVESTAMNDTSSRSHTIFK